MDYIVYEILPGGGLSEPRSAHHSLEDATNWAKDKATEWQLYMGTFKSYCIYYRGYKCQIVNSGKVRGF